MTPGQGITGLRREGREPIFEAVKRNPEDPRPQAEPENVARGEELRNMFNRARAFTEDLLR